MTTTVDQSAQTVLTGVNPLVAPTWRWMGMNGATLQLPASKPASPQTIAFDSAAPGLRELAVGEQDVFAAHLEATATAADFESGAGAREGQWLAANATRHLLIEVPAGNEAHRDFIVRIEGADAASAVLLIDVIAHDDASAHLVIELDSPEKGSGIVGSRLRVFAGQRARVDIEQLQTLDDSWIHLDDVAVHASDGAKVTLRQTVLGGGESYVGFAANLAGYASSCEVDTRYLGSGERLLDFNYLVRQRARKTSGVLNANGVLTGSSQKILRGTIDLIRGCKGSVGRENETVLLTGDAVRNKTIPIILCTEDDVQGDHGATIGHVDPAQLEYLQSRGLGIDQAEALFARSVFDYAAVAAHDEISYKAIDRRCREVCGVGLDDETGEVHL